MPEITADQLRALLVHDSATGEFRWLTTLNGRARQGEIAGSLDPRGYRRIAIKGTRYSAHRLVWLYAHGAWPQGELDHINGVHADNRLCNLRDVLPQVNKQNLLKANKDSGSGLLGAFRNGKRWMARIEVDGRKVYIGTYDTPEQAHAAYLEKKRLLHPGCML